MKFELKTENDNYSKSCLYFFKTALIIAFVIISSDVALKLGIISRHYQIEYNCKLLSVRKSPSTIKNLSRLLDLKSKQSIREFCREVVR